MEEESKCELRMKLPGFRFHPTEEELLNFYLKAIVFGHKLRGDVIGFLNIYNYDPNDLPKLAKTGEREWYFFVPRDRKHGGGGRPNRTTEKGFWKATGSDRQIPSTSDPKKILGLKKTLVFYQGRAPRGTKTNWIMNEYRLPHNHKSPAPQQEIVLCKIYMKATSLKVLEQRAATDASSSLSPPMDASLSSASFCSMQFEEEEGSNSTMIMTKGLKREREEENHDQILVVEEERQRRGGCLSSISISSSSSSLVLPNGLQNLAELQVPKLNMDWTQDSFWTQLSPWIDNFTPFLPLC